MSKEINTNRFIYQNYVYKTTTAIWLVSLWCTECTSGKKAVNSKLPSSQIHCHRESAYNRQQLNKHNKHVVMSTG